MQHVQDAKSVEEILSVASQLPLPGEETLHWQKQAHHREKMQSVCSLLSPILAA
jgi:hypothetical protein